MHSALGAPLTPRGIVCVRHRTGELWSAKQKMDPKGVLGNTLIDSLLLPDEELAARSQQSVAATAKDPSFFKARGWF